MNDTISRQAAYATALAMYTRCDTGDIEDYRDLMCESILALPSAQQWIPCSERLPELDESVLATTTWNDITIAWRIGICEWFIHEGNTNAETADVIAWMPLPEPYKGGRDE